MSESAFTRVLVTGGGGYIGSALVPRLLARGHRVRVLDLYLFGRDALAASRNDAAFEDVCADVRDTDAIRAALRGVDAVIHLACISNDPSCELDPDLTRSVNLESFEPLLRLAREAGVRRFIFASSSSVYGISDAEQITEDHPQRPLTLYNRYKAECEELLFRYNAPRFTTVALRPATICGRSARQRLDLTVNILTTHAVERGVITVFGGEQKRPSLHIRDMVHVYEMMLDAPSPAIAGQAFNVACANHTVAELAELVRKLVEEDMPEKGPIRVDTRPSDDRRSYHVCADKIRKHLDFIPRWTVQDAVRELAAALRAGEVANPLDDPLYYNVRRMKQVGLH